MTDEAWPLVGAVVVGWNHRGDSAECIDSILHAGYPALYVWYVDNGSTDGAPVFLRQKFPAVRVVELGENRGLVGGYNAGIKAALDADMTYVCLFNNDTVIQPGSFRALVRAARADDRAGLLVPKIVLYSDEHILWSAGARERFFPPGIVQRGLGLRSGDRRFAQVESVEYATSCVWMMASQMVREVGFFDPQYSFYYSDYDYNKRATLLGWKIIYIPDALVKHKVSLSTQKGPNAAHWWRNMGEAEVRFYRQYKNGVKLSLHMLWIIMRTILQGKGQYVPAYLSGVRRGFDI